MTRRKWNETDEDLLREMKAGILLANKWRMDVHKCAGEYYPFDFYMTPKDPGINPVICEVKTKRYPGKFIVSTMKAINMLQYAACTCST